MYKIYHSTCLAVLLVLFVGFSAQANIYPFNNTYTAAAANVVTSAQGRIVGTYNDVTNTISYSIVFSGLTTNSTVAHFHGPATPTQDAGVQLGHTGFPAGVTQGSYSATQTLTEAQEAQLLGGLWYSNIHTTKYPGGEIRTQIIMSDAATTSPFRNTYTAANSTVTTPATGTIIGTYNQQTNTISYSIVFSGLTTNSTVAHFHGPATPTQDAGVQLGHTGFPTGVTSGFYSNTQPLTEAQETQLLSGLWYSNIHTTRYPGGETRAQIMLTDILPPVISGVTVTPSRLWPANHKMVNVSVGYTSQDNFPGAVSCAVTVSSNEPVTSAEDNTSPDWVVTGAQSVQLRAERLGKGSGRIYTVTVTCTDAQGNSSSRTATVVVPHDRSGGAVTRAGTIGEENLLPGVHLSVAPNPTKSYFTIGIRSVNSAEKLQLHLYDVSGRLVERKDNVPTEASLQIGANLKAGVYLLRLAQGSEVRQLRLVKMD